MPRAGQRTGFVDEPVSRAPAISMRATRSARTSVTNALYGRGASGEPRGQKTKAFHTSSVESASHHQARFRAGGFVGFWSVGTAHQLARPRFGSGSPVAPSQKGG